MKRLGFVIAGGGVTRLGCVVAARRVKRLGVASAVLAGLAIMAAGCGAVQPGDSGGRVRVVAAENFWGSIASQVGGPHVHVATIITNPDADPHSYEPTPADGRSIATAKLVIENGVGYDPWTPKLRARVEALAVLRG